jgi:hypothetical protein
MWVTFVQRTTRIPIIAFPGVAPPTRPPMPRYSQKVCKLTVTRVYLHWTEHASFRNKQEWKCSSWSYILYWPSLQTQISCCKSITHNIVTQQL